MKRYKRVFILVAVLAVASIATLALTQYEEKQEQIRTSNEIIMQIPSENVQSVSWDYSGGDGLSFHKTDSGWSYEDDEAFPVSEKRIMEILKHFESYGVTFVIENVTDYAQYGLDDPECTLHLGTPERSYDIKMGDFSKMDEQRYIDIGDGNVYLVSEDPVDYVDSSLSAMIQHDDTPGFETVVDITFTGDENYTIIRKDESTDTYAPESDIYFVQRNGKTVPLETSSVRQFLNTVTALKLSSYVTYNATEEELQTYGLDTPDLSVTVNYTYTNDDGETVADTCVLHISENPAERQAADEAIAAGKNAESVSKYVRIDDSKIVYELNSADYAILTAVSYDDLRHDEVFWGDFDIVSRIDIDLEGKKHTLTRTIEDTDNVWSFGEETVDIDDLQSALEALAADSFTDELPGEVEEIGLTLHLEDENFPTVQIRLYRYNGSSCLAVVNGEPISLISRSAVMDLVETVQTIVLN